MIGAVLKVRAHSIQRSSRKRAPWVLPLQACLLWKCRRLACRNSSSAKLPTLESLIMHFDTQTFIPLGTRSAREPPIHCSHLLSLRPSPPDSRVQTANAPGQPSRV